MAVALKTLSPEAAWSPYEPGRAGDRPWDLAAAAHLHRRAGFGAPMELLRATVEASPADAVQALLDPWPRVSQADRARFDAEMDLMARTVNDDEDQGHQLAAWWLYRMLATPHPLLERATLLWHGHFATSNAKVRHVGAMRRQNETLRLHALGRFEPMVQQMSRDPAMLMWLDATVNRKARPNENYARELMELFCLGEGHYAERDIKEIARAFTGWELRRDTFVFNRYQHDEGEKSFLGARGPFNGDDAVRTVLAQDAAPRFIAAKLVRCFVCEEPPLADPVLEPLARQLRETGFDLAAAVRRILLSRAFFASAGTRVRSPVELGVGLLRTLRARTDMLELAQALERLGQGVFYPPSVKGWDGGRAWIDTSTLLGRANLVRTGLTHAKTRWPQGDLAAQADAAGARSEADALQWLSDLMLAVPLAPQARDAVLSSLREQGGLTHAGLATALHTLSVMPEFQLA